VKLWKRYLPVAAVLGAAVAIVPASALATAPSEVRLEIAEHCYFADWPCWNVKGNNPEDIRQIQPFTIAQGGMISFEDNEARYPTDVLWQGAAPSCTSGVPVAPPTKTGWSGTCTFATAGDYKFESQALFNEEGFDYTKYEVVVEGSASAPAPGPVGEGGSKGAPAPGGGTSNPTPSGGEAPSGSPLSGAPTIGSSQRGTTVKGSLQVSKAGAGDRLVVELVAPTASLANAGRSTQVVGRSVSASVSAGRQSFSVKLDAKAKRALKRRHRLALKVKITLIPAHGQALSVTRSVTLHG
jgi:hypothetical protein